MPPYLQVVHIQFNSNNKSVTTCSIIECLVTCVSNMYLLLWFTCALHIGPCITFFKKHTHHSTPSHNYTPPRTYAIPGGVSPTIRHGRHRHCAWLLQLQTAKKKQIIEQTQTQICSSLKNANAFGTKHRSNNPVAWTRPTGLFRLNANRKKKQILCGECVLN